jgi:hypothetical protein
MAILARVELAQHDGQSGMLPKHLRTKCWGLRPSLLEYFLCKCCCTWPIRISAFLYLEALCIAYSHLGFARSFLKLLRFTIPESLESDRYYVSRSESFDSINIHSILPRERNIMSSLIILDHCDDLLAELVFSWFKEVFFEYSFYLLSRF